VDNMKDSSTRGTPKAFVSPAKIGRAGFPSGWLQGSCRTSP